MISKIERGESSPTAVVLGKLSAALELSVSELLGPDEAAGRRRGGPGLGADSGAGDLAGSGRTRRRG